MEEQIIHVAIVEDNDDIRQTLALIINGTPGFHCKHTYIDAESAIKEIPNIYVNVVLMDVDLPGINGVQATKRIKEMLPEVDMIMLTIHRDDETVFRSLCAGATGYLVKETPPAELLRAIEDVVKGGAPMSAAIARKVIGSFQRVVNNPLTERENEILESLCKGLNYKVIAEEKFVSPVTVKSHIKNIYRTPDIRWRFH